MPRIEIQCLMVTRKLIDDMLADVSVCLKYLHENYRITISRFDQTAIDQIARFLAGPNKYDLDHTYFTSIFFLCLAEINYPVEIVDDKLMMCLDGKRLDIESFIGATILFSNGKILKEAYKMACSMQQCEEPLEKTMWFCNMGYKVIPFRIYSST